MENKITELLLSTDKALKELYINFVHYKDAKKNHNLQEKNKIKIEYANYESIKNELEKLKKLYAESTKKNLIIKEKISKLKEKLQEIINKDKLV